MLTYQESTDRPDGVMGTAVLSEDGVYRYSLARIWANHKNPSVLAFVMLNPSTADAMEDDPTIRRCMGFARALDYDGIMVRNLFALRATDPRALAGHRDPAGPDNPMALHGIAGKDQVVICAWGAHAMAIEAGRNFLQHQVQPGVITMCLGRTKHGAPRHPLYLPAKTGLEGYSI